MDKGWASGPLHLGLVGERLSLRERKESNWARGPGGDYLFKLLTIGKEG